MVLWTSFLTGRNCEEEVLAAGNEEMWDIQVNQKDTFFSGEAAVLVLDLPGYSYDSNVHAKSRALLKNFFSTESAAQREEWKKEYLHDAFAHHQVVKEMFISALSRPCDLVIGYFSILDVVGHVSFGNSALMKMLYHEIDEIASLIHVPYLVLSDHGMKALGCYGDHSSYGFWSSDTVDLGFPRLTDFSSLMPTIFRSS